MAEEVISKSTRFSSRRIPSRIVGFTGGYAASVIGDQIWLTILGWTAATFSESMVAGIILSAGTLPRALLMLFGGSLIDRFGIRYLVLATQVGRIGLMVVAAVAAAVASNAWVPVVIVAFIFGIIDAVNIPALDSAPTLITSPEQLPRMTGIMQTLNRLAMVAGAPIGGFLIAVGGVSVTSLICAAFFLLALSALSSSRLPARTESADSSEGGIRGGIKYVWRHPILRPLIMVIGLLNFTILSSFNVGLALLVHARDWSATTYGFLGGAFGFAAVVGALAVVLRRPTKYPVRAGLVWVALQAPFIASLAWLHQPALVAVSVSGIGLTLAPASSLLFGMLQALAESGYIGRVMSLVSFLSATLVPISYLVFSFVSEVASLSIAFILSGSLQATVVLLAMLTPNLRRAQAPGNHG